MKQRNPLQWLEKTDITPTGHFQKVLSQQKPRAGRRVLLEGDKDNPKCSLLPEPQRAPHLGHNSYFHGDATKGHSGIRNLRDTQVVSAAFDFRQELNSIYWKMFGGSKISPSLISSKNTVLQMGARISSRPFSSVIPEAHTFHWLVNVDH